MSIFLYQDKGIWLLLTYQSKIKYLYKIWIWRRRAEATAAQVHSQHLAYGPATLSTKHNNGAPYINIINSWSQVFLTTSLILSINMRDFFNSFFSLWKRDIIIHVSLCISGLAGWSRGTKTKSNPINILGTFHYFKIFTYRFFLWGLVRVGSVNPVPDIIRI